MQCRCFCPLPHPQAELQKVGFLVYRKENRTFSNICCKSQHIWHKKTSMLLIYDIIQLQMNTLEKKTSICSISCIILWLNSENSYFGHFWVENQDTGRKKSFFFATLPSRRICFLREGGPDRVKNFWTLSPHYPLKTEHIE